MRGDIIPPPPTGVARRQQVAGLNGPAPQFVNALGASPVALHGNPLGGAAMSPYANALGLDATPSSVPMQVPSPVMPPPAAPATPPSMMQPQATPGANASPAASGPMQMSQLLSRMQIPPGQLAQIADTEDHIVQATGTLLQQRGTITEQDVNDALDRATGGGKVTKEVAQQFAKALPPASNQDALRGALATQRAKSVQSLVALHGEAQGRGIGLSSLQGAPMAQPSTGIMAPGQPGGAQPGQQETA